MHAWTGSVARVAAAGGLNDQHHGGDSKDNFGTTLLNQAGETFVTSSVKSPLQCIDL